MKKIIFLASLIVVLFGGVCGAQTTDGARAYKYLDAKEYDKALGLADSLIVANPGYDGSIIFKATVLNAMGKPRAGSRLIDRFMKKQDNNSVAFYIKRGHTKALAKLYKQSIHDYDKAYEHLGTNDPLLKELLMGRSRARYAIRSYKSIYYDMQELLAVDSTDYSGLIMMVNVLNWLNNTDEIMIYLERCVKLYPDDALVYANLAYRYQNMGDYDMAIQLNSKAIALDNTSTYFYNNRGFDKYKLNDLAGAMADIEIAMQKDPENSFAYKNRALVYIAQKERDKACADLQTALDKGFTLQYGPDVKELIKANCSN